MKTLAATITAVVTGDNPFAAPDLITNRVYLFGTIDCSPVFTGQLYGTVTGRTLSGVPFTGVYNLASVIATELTNAKVVEIGLWNPVTQTSTRWVYTGGTWTGTNFAITPGSGVYLIIVSSFTWTPILITPAVP